MASRRAVCEFAPPRAVSRRLGYETAGRAGKMWRMKPDLCRKIVAFLCLLAVARPNLFAQTSSDIGVLDSAMRSRGFSRLKGVSGTATVDQIGAILFQRLFTKCPLPGSRPIEYTYFLISDESARLFEYRDAKLMAIEQGVPKVEKMNGLQGQGVIILKFSAFRWMPWPSENPTSEGSKWSEKEGFFGEGSFHGALEKWSGQWFFERQLSEMTSPNSTQSRPSCKVLMGNQYEEKPRLKEENSGPRDYKGGGPTIYTVTEDDFRPKQVAPGAPVAGNDEVMPTDVSADDAKRLLVKKAQPIYPPIAKASRVEGIVTLNVTVTKDGAVEDVKAVNGPAMLRQAAIDAVRQWQYRPYLIAGGGARFKTTVDVTFSLSGR